MYESNNFHDIYIHGLDEHLNNYEYFNKPRDSKQLEKIFYAFKLNNPIERVCYEKSRKTNIIFMFAEFLWYISGNNSLEFISYYAPSIARFSNDKKTLTGTAYGKKIRKYDYRNSTLDQVEKIIDLLKHEPDTKRAVIIIFTPDELIDYKKNIDVSCTLSLQFLIRDQKLDLIVNMRANDMYMGVLSDVFSFTLIQEYVSLRLGIELGRYIHVTGSSHIYEPDFERATYVLSHSSPYERYDYTFPRMEEHDIDHTLMKVLEIERELRENSKELNYFSQTFCELPDYWKQVILLFEVYREIRTEGNIQYRVFEMLYPIYKYFINNRFGRYLLETR